MYSRFEIYNTFRPIYILYNFLVLVKILFYDQIFIIFLTGGTKNTNEVLKLRHFYQNMSKFNKNLLSYDFSMSGTQIFIW